MTAPNYLNDMSKQPGTTRDHHVPQMYLKRFAVPRGTSSRIIVADVWDATKKFTTDVKNVGVETGFYWGTDQEGIPHHDMEKFLTAIEALAARAFRFVLDTGRLPGEDALPPWPLRRDHRRSLSWWIAAQILRTTRQRTRLELGSSSYIEPPRHLGRANRHIKFIAQWVEPLASAIFHRPWGVGFSDFCLLTGDVPVLVLNGQDAHDQALAAEYWDIYVPLDPHRCLFLPGIPIRQLFAPSVDHRLKLHPGIGLALNNAVADTAVKHIFWHPQHDPTAHLHLRSRRSLEKELEADWLPRYVVSYEVLPAGSGVERRWLDQHPPVRTNDGSQCGDGSKPEITEIVQRMSGHLDQAEEVFRQLQAQRPAP
ncbi:DUF4238 domain-containing protein [Mycobacterium sp. 3519A]|uniref:DUF4238 domain-containing protein n=1 Tax=Mycobacterium sp. 3519A TaxID=2057184 RepID=UPI0011592C98|nr:DUF4238 domain-containing protein [Mycobacterium sp. 3519A]